MEQSVTQCRELAAPFFTISLSRDFMVRTSLYFYLLTAFRAPIILCADHLHRISLKSDNKCSKSTYAQDFIYVPNYTTASIRRFSRTPRSLEIFVRMSRTELHRKWKIVENSGKFSYAAGILNIAFTSPL